MDIDITFYFLLIYKLNVGFFIHFNGENEFLYFT